MDDSRRERERRAEERRRSWKIEVLPLAESTQATGGDTPEARLAAMWQVALDAWAMTGQPFPSYARDQAPGRVIRPPGRSR